MTEDIRWVLRVVLIIVIGVVASEYHRRQHVPIPGEENDNQCKIYWCP
jgi:hypothetical protein